MIPKLKVTSSDEFFQNHVSASRPAVITHAMTGWACSKWTDDYLAEKLGERRHRINRTADGRFGVYSMRERQGETCETCNWREFLDLLKGEPEFVHYMEQVPIHPESSGLHSDINFVEFLDSSKVEAVNFWCSQARSQIPLHWDSRDNLLAQVRGRKSVRLYSPKYSENLYPGLEGAQWASKVSMGHPDLELFPKFRDAKVEAEFEIAEGEILFIPRFWWHHIVTESDFSISINFWYSKSLCPSPWQPAGT